MTVKALSGAVIGNVSDGLNVTTVAPLGMFVFGDVIMAGSLGKGWVNGYAEAMKPVGTNLELKVYNYKVNGEFKFINNRSTTAAVYGDAGSNVVSSSSSTSIVIPAIGYYTITLNLATLTYSIAALTSTNEGVTNMNIIGQGLTGYAGNDWTLANAIPMTNISTNVFVKNVTRTNAASSFNKLITGAIPEWANLYTWINELNPDAIGTNNFEMGPETALTKFNSIYGFENEVFTFKVDMFLNKGIVVPGNSGVCETVKTGLWTELTT